MGADSDRRHPQAREIGRAGAEKTTEDHQLRPDDQMAMRTCRGSGSALLKATLRRTLSLCVSILSAECGARGALATPLAEISV
jgi:hypothetical protein